MRRRWNARSGLREAPGYGVPGAGFARAGGEDGHRAVIPVIHGASTAWPTRVVAGDPDDPRGEADLRDGVVMVAWSL